MDTDRNASPLNPLPAGVWLIVLPIIAIEAAFQAGAQGWIGGAQAVGWRLAAIERYGFFDTVFEWMLVGWRFTPEHVLRFVSYGFVHMGAVHALFVVVLAAALGKMVGEIFRLPALLAVWFTALIVGAVTFGLLVDAPQPLVGGYPGVFGLVGAFTFLMWVDLAAKGANRYRAFLLIGMLLLIRLILGLISGADVAWIADLAGFGAGFALSFLVSPGAWPRVVERLRRR
jgi:membrane associated rhomboid family serine protease